VSGFLSGDTERDEVIDFIFFFYILPLLPYLISMRKISLFLFLGVATFFLAS
jgi:hypothetical protein